MGLRKLRAAQIGEIAAICVVRDHWFSENQRQEKVRRVTTVDPTDPRIAMPGKLPKLPGDVGTYGLVRKGCGCWSWMPLVTDEEPDRPPW